MATQGPPINCSITLLKNPKERITFESFPDSLNDNYSCTISSRQSKTASENVSSEYNGGNYSDLNLSLKFVAGLHSPKIGRQITKEQREVQLNEELEELEKKIRWIQALAFPKPSSDRPSYDKRFSSVGKPPMVIVTFGQFWRIQGIVHRVDISWSSFHPDTVRPRIADVSITIKRVASYYSDWYDITKIASRRTVLEPLVGTWPMEQATTSIVAPKEFVQQATPLPPM